MSQFQDLVAIIKGVQKVAESSGRLHKACLSSAWANSTLKALPADVCGNSALSLQPPSPSEVVQRVSVVLSGLRHFLQPLSVPSPPGDSLPRAEVDELNNRFNSIFDVSNFEKFMDENTRNKITAEKERSARAYSNFRRKHDSEQGQSTSASHLQASASAGAPSMSSQPGESKVLFEDLNKIFQTVEKDLKSIENKNVNIEETLKELSIEERRDEGAEAARLAGRPQTSKQPPKAKQSLSASSKQRVVPSTRIGRMFAFGSLGLGLGIGTATEYVKNAIQPKSKKSDDLGSMFLSTANAERIVDTLCKVRGAALKLGQLLSLQDESVMSPELQKIFERVRQSADFMPKFQVEQMLSADLGANWRDRFKHFEEKPFAAASIGQVHLGVLHDGTEVAVKIQYPGVAKGINSDIDNLVSVLNVWDIFPKGLFIDNIVEVAKKELAWEVNYVREAECTRKFKKLLEPYPKYYVPAIIDDLCNEQVITTELVEGLPLDKCFSMDHETREDIAYSVMSLCLREMFEFRCMQTDPNWSNFFYNPANKKLILLDFGATREYSKQFMNKYIQIIKAASDGDREDVLVRSREMKFLTGYESKVMEEAHIDTVMVMAEIFTPKSGRKFDFGSQDTTRRLQALVPTILTHRLCPPPEEIYSLHRKLSGVFLLCAKLKVEMDCRDMFQAIYDTYDFSD